MDRDLARPPFHPWAGRTPLKGAQRRYRAISAETDTVSDKKKVTEPAS
jgi:hypothetical protein